MGLGTKVKIDVNQYLNILQRAGFSKDVTRLRTTMRSNGIGFNGSFYSGSSVSDGTIFYATRTGANSLGGFLRFLGAYGPTGAIAKRIAAIIARADKIWARAARIINLARQQDKYPGGINPEHLIKICARHRLTLPTRKPTTMKGALNYERNAVRMIEEVLKHYSAYKSIEERPRAVGCVIKTYVTPAPSCPRGVVGYKGSETYATCIDIGADVLVKSISGGC